MKPRNDRPPSVWLLGVGTPEGDRIEVDFGAFEGMQYGVFDPATVSDASAGTGVLEFTSRDTAIFNYTPSEFSMDNFGHMTPVEDLEIQKIFELPADDDFDAAE